MISFDYWRQRFVYLTKKKIEKIEGGLAEIYFNDKGLMDHVKISVSKTSNGTLAPSNISIYALIIATGFLLNGLSLYGLVSQSIAFFVTWNWTVI